MRLIALLATYNEERFIANCLQHLFRQGAEVYLLDNDSHDQTVAIARQYLGRGLLGIERFPREGVFRSAAIIARKEKLALELPADWCMHVDADEIHTPRRSEQTLAQVFAEVEAQGFNAVNFQEFTFSPTVEQPDHDHPNYPQTLRWYYPFLPFAPHRLNAWKRQATPVELAFSGGHRVRFPGLRMYPETLWMRHYLFLSAAHAQRKYVQLQYAPEELAKGWYGKRAMLKPESIWLPGQKDLRCYRTDEELDPSTPRKTHLLFG